MIAHIVLFSPKSGLGITEQKSLALTIQETCKAVPCIQRAMVGRSVDVDPGYGRVLGNKTYEFAAVLEFKDRNDLIGYLNHPSHARLGAMFWEYCDHARAVVIEIEMLRSDDPTLVQFLTNPR